MRLGVIGTGRIGAMHAATLRDLARVDEVVVADADSARAREVAASLAISAADTVDDLIRAGPDGVVIAAATHAHPGLIHSCLERGLPVFCEKPIALDVEGTHEVVRHVHSSGVALQVGFQRRFDPGYRTARAALRSGALGWPHTLRAVTADATPPPAGYLPTSGGLFRDCGIHDFDIIRWISGAEVVAVFATGANQGADFFTASGDVDTCAAVLEMDSGLLATVSATRYNGAGYDVRLEVCGSDGASFVGNDENAALPSAEAGVRWPIGPPHRTFVERFRQAYTAELDAFLDVLSGQSTSPCSGEDALEALYIAEACESSRIEQRRVTLAEVRR